MNSDKQLANVRLDEVLEKRRLDQALSAKEFAVLAGISYSTARSWFHSPGFPALHGHVFWNDFVLWRQARTSAELKGFAAEATTVPPSGKAAITSGYSLRTAKILADAG